MWCWGGALLHNLLVNLLVELIGEQKNPGAPHLAVVHSRLSGAVVGHVTVCCRVATSVRGRRPGAAPVHSQSSSSESY